MEKITRIGMDTSKHIFQLHGVDEGGKTVLRKKLGRKAMVAFFETLPATIVGIEACGGSHHWGRLWAGFGHEVKLIPAQHVKPYVKRGKNDAADAEAICEAMNRPSLHFVPVKSPEQQAIQMVIGMRHRLIRERTRLVNTIRGFAAEYGLVAARGIVKVDALLTQIAQNEALPLLARELFKMHGTEYAQLQIQLQKVEKMLMTLHRQNEVSRRLAQIPGIGPIGAMLLAAKVTDIGAFASGRSFAAWIGLTPKDHSTGGKTRLGRISRAGDDALRSVLVLGATAVIRQASNGRGDASAWLASLLKRKPAKLAAVALANKTARIAWKLMTTGQHYDPFHGSHVNAMLTA
jgi:transposase